MVDLLETTVLALGLSYVGFDIYFLAAAFSWSHRLRAVNRDVLVFSGFRDVLNFVYQGPVPGVVEDLAGNGTSTERAGRVVSEAYPELVNQLGDTHERFDLPQRLEQLQRDAVTFQWLSAALATGLVLLFVFAIVVPYGVVVPYGYEVMIAVVLGNSVLMIPFASTRAQIDVSLRQSAEVLARARASRGGPGPSVANPTPNRR